MWLYDYAELVSASIKLLETLTMNLKAILVYIVRIYNVIQNSINGDTRNRFNS